MLAACNICFLKLKINPLVPDAHYSERQYKQVSLQIKLIEVTAVKLRIFIFCTLGTNGLNRGTNVPVRHRWVNFAEAIPPEQQDVARVQPLQQGLQGKGGKLEKESQMAFQIKIFK